jgi:hypothetical protein
MIRTVKCLGCDISFEVKYFLGHVKSCRMCYNIPSMVTKDNLISKMSHDNHKFMTSGKVKLSLGMSMMKDSVNGPSVKKSYEF